MNKYIIKALGWEEIQALINDLLEFCLEANLKEEDVRGLIRLAQILNDAEELEEKSSNENIGFSNSGKSDKSSNEDCFCPFAKEHCTNGHLVNQEGHIISTECEFWNPQAGDCRVRLVLALLETRLKEAKSP
jgi:hypothetical protein